MTDVQRPSSAADPRTTRLAPSPTGALHLGNARTFLINWVMARQTGQRVVLRIEDLDTPRTKQGADVEAIEDLAWLGMDWDVGPIDQRADLSPYTAALESLASRELIYPCVCTRKEIVAAQSAPHADEHELRYPGTCRRERLGVGDSGLGIGQGKEVGSTPAADPPNPQSPDAKPQTALRVLAPTTPVTFHDNILGDQTIDVDAEVGDFVVATKAGLPAYQLAVVVDDARQGVTDVVRGDDLVRSTGRQIWLYELLNLGPPPSYWHLPLVLGQDGRRLAKRHGDTRIAYYREQGVAPQRMLGLIASWCGLCDKPTPMDIDAFQARFDIAALPRSPVTFRPEDDAWLLDR